ncbi:MAG: hypothetical protein ACC618_01105 [Patescibacteria group bacterium]
MKLELLIDELNSLNLPRDLFAVTSSGAMAVRGLREANDIDVLVTEELWKKLASKYPLRRTPKGFFIKLSKNVEVMGGWSNTQKNDLEGAGRQIKNAERIDGIRFVRLSDVKKFKKKVGRKKDFEDIKLIDSYLKSGSLNKT